MRKVKQGDRVRIDFIGKLSDGTVFDSTLEESPDCGDDCHDDDCGDEGCGCGETGPFEMTLGAGEFFPLVEEALIGMSVGEKKIVQIPCAEALGDHDESRVFTVERSELPDDFPAEVGQELVLTDEDDEPFGVTVLEVTESTVTFDANHPLAGEDLTYEIELREIL